MLKIFNLYERTKTNVIKIMMIKMCDSQIWIIVERIYIAVRPPFISINSTDSTWNLCSEDYEG